VSTSLDGSPAPADPGDADRSGGPRRRRAQSGTEDSGALWIQEEMRRRMEARAAHPARGRHARDDADTEEFGVDAIAARLRTGPGGVPVQPPAPPVPPQAWQNGPAPSYQDYAGPVQEPYVAAPVAPWPSGPPSSPPGEATRPEPEEHPDYLAYEDYDDEDDPDLVDEGEPAPFERVLGPASVPMRQVPPEQEPTPPPGPGGMRQFGNTVDRAGRRAPAPDTLGGPLVPREPAPPTMPTGVPGPQSWPQPGGPEPRDLMEHADLADLEATDVGTLPPIPASAPPARPVAPPVVVEAEAPAPTRPVGARFDARVVEDDDPDIPKRVRVVLSERKGVARTVRTVVDVQEGTAVGELLRANLIRGQLGVALRVGMVALLVLGALPILFAVYPQLGTLEVLGLRLPWLLLGVLVYPFLLLLGWWHTKAAERVEQNFADHVQD
jgi:hypothetical protein